MYCINNPSVIFDDQGVGADPNGYCGENVTWTYDAVNHILTITGSGAMYDYAKYGGSTMERTPWNPVQEDIATVRVEEGVTALGSYVFADCLLLKQVELPSMLKSIGEGAFEDSNALTTITIPDSVTTIGDTAFRECKALRNATMPQSLKTIGDRAFDGCAMTTVVLPEGLEAIGEEAFTGVPLAEVTLPDSLTSMGAKAFCNCKQLTQTSIGSGLHGIPNYCFADSALTSVEIPANVTSIGIGAFYGCTNLAEARILGTNVTIDYDAFSMEKDDDIIALPQLKLSAPAGSQTLANLKAAGYTAASPITTQLTTSNTTVKVANATWTGKNLMPTVAVKVNGKKLKAGTDYTVAYSKNKNVGTGTATIAGKGAYTGKVSQGFTINPKGTSIKKLKAGKKSFTASWKKQAKQTTGYELRYSLRKNLKSAKVKTVGKAKTVKLIVRKLKAKKRYYVQVRTYKTVGGKKYCSAWSKTKSVKTK